MNNKNLNIDQQLQDKLSEFAPMPAAFIWDQLDAKLENKATKKRRVVLITSIAASTIAVVASSIFYFGGHSNELQSENKKINNVIIQNNQNDKIDNQQIEKSTISTPIEGKKEFNLLHSPSSASNNSERNSVIDASLNIFQNEEIVNANNEI